MKKIDRHNKISNLINEKNNLTFDQVFSLFEKEAKMTIHRDLNILISMGKIHKLDNMYCNDAFIKENIDFVKSISGAEAKTKLAQKVNSLLVKDLILYISPGTTNEILVKHIKKPCKVYTNSLPVYKNAYINKNIKASLIGGDDKLGKNIFTGGQTILSIQKIFFDMTILSVAAIDDRGWLSNSNEDESLIESTSILNSKEIMVIAEKEKFNKNKNYKFYNINECDALVTNKKDIPKSIKIKTYNI